MTTDPSSLAMDSSITLELTQSPITIRAQAAAVILLQEFGWIAIQLAKGISNVEPGMHGKNSNIS